MEAPSKRSRESKAPFPLWFDVVGEAGLARAGVFRPPHGPVQTPMFMPVGTQASVKGLLPFEVEHLGARLILGNTYHLAVRPGIPLLRHHRGLHAYESRPHNLLTDSGGFQMVSLLALAQINEEGVTFRSPHDNSSVVLTPEESVATQCTLGSDIIMQLDDVVHVSTVGPRLFCEGGPRVEEAMLRSIRWLDRCIAANVHEDAPHPETGKQQLLFAIVQGGLQPDLRTKSLELILERRQHLGGIAIGGLSGGEAKDDFWRTVAHCTERLPAPYVRYCMGVGYPEDLVTCVALGVDIFDCVFPCRTARFGTALTSVGRIQTRAASVRHDFGPLDPNCDCRVCTNYTRAYFAAVMPRSPVGCALLSYHNLYYLIHLMSRARDAIAAGKDAFSAFVNTFLRQQFGIGVSSEQVSSPLVPSERQEGDAKRRRGGDGGKGAAEPSPTGVPGWIIDAMGHARVELDEDIIAAKAQ